METWARSGSHCKSAISAYEMWKQEQQSKARFSQLHRELETSLGCMRPCQKNK